MVSLRGRVIKIYLHGRTCFLPVAAFSSGILLYRAQKVMSSACRRDFRSPGYCSLLFAVIGGRVTPGVLALLPGKTGTVSLVAGDRAGLSLDNTLNGIS